MSATDELRRLLDERGIIWQDKTNDGDRCEILPGDSVTWWFDSNDVLSAARENFGHKLALRCECTPVQAVEITVGRERWCRLVDLYGDWYCTNCDEMVGTCDSTSELHVDGNTVEHLWKYCPYCGARMIASVVEL